MYIPEEELPNDVLECHSLIETLLFILHEWEKIEGLSGDEITTIDMVKNEFPEGVPLSAGVYNGIGT